MADSVTITDALTRTVFYSIAASDSPAVLDAIEREHYAVRFSDDSVTITDTAEPNLTRTNVDIADSITASDSIGWRLNPATRPYFLAVDDLAAHIAVDDLESHLLKGFTA